MSGNAHERMGTVDLSSIPIDELHAEIARRKAAAKTSGRPMRHKTKAEWARAKVVEVQAQKAALKSESGTGGDRERRRRHEQYIAMDAEIAKFKRLADKYEREGI